MLRHKIIYIRQPTSDHLDDFDVDSFPLLTDTIELYYLHPFGVTSNGKVWFTIRSTVIAYNRITQ